MFEKLLRAKHWQVFIIAFGIPFILGLAWYFYLLYSMFQMATSGHLDGDPNQSLEFMVDKFKSLPLLFIGYLPLFAWYFSSGATLQKYLPLDAQLKTGLFKISVVTALAALFIMAFSLSSFYSHMPEWMNNNQPTEDFASKSLVFGIVVLIAQLFILVCQIYNWYFMAKTIKSGELKRTARFSDYIGEFFLIMFWPIGVWFLQPKINQIVLGDKEEEFIVTDEYN